MEKENYKTPARTEFDDSTVKLSNEQWKDMRSRE